MGLFDKLFGEKTSGENADKMSAVQVHEEKKVNQESFEKKESNANSFKKELNLFIPRSDLEKGLLRNGIRYGANTDSVKTSEPLPLNNKGADNGKPWLIFMKESTQIIYNFDRNDGELDQISHQYDSENKAEYESLCTAYYRFFTEQYGEPVAPQMLKVKSVLSRAMINCAEFIKFMTVMLNIQVEPPKRFDTWIVETDNGKVKIDLLSLEIQSVRGYHIFVSYKLLPNIAE